MPGRDGLALSTSKRLTCVPRWSYSLGVPASFSRKALKLTYYHDVHLSRIVNPFCRLSPSHMASTESLALEYFHPTYTTNCFPNSTLNIGLPYAYLIAPSSNLSPFFLKCVGGNSTFLLA